MQLIKDTLLTINTGSSSIKFAFYFIDSRNTRLSGGHIENIAEGRTNFHFSTEERSEHVCLPVKTGSYADSVDFLVDWLTARPEMNTVKVIGHRIVYGLNREAPVVITPEILTELDQTKRYDPQHMPGALTLIKELRNSFPAVQEIACFD